MSTHTNAGNLVAAFLSEKQRMALNIHARFGTTKKVAELMGIHPCSASRLLTRARAKVKAGKALVEDLRRELARE